MNLFDIINIVIKEEFPDNRHRQHLIADVIKLYVGGQTEIINVLLGERRYDNCNYWFKKEINSVGRYECHLNSPVIIKFGGNGYNTKSFFPTANANDWCGKFSPKPKADEPEVEMRNK